MTEKNVSSHLGWRKYLALYFVLGMGWLAPSYAEESQPTAQSATELEAAIAAAREVSKSGPLAVSLRDQALVNLPGGYVFIPPPAASKIMTAMGNTVGSNFLGLIFPQQDAGWFVVADFEPSGYIKDDDAKKWDIDELFKSLKDGTEASNEERKSRGFPEMEIIGWIERPQYDANTHRLVWSMSARDKGAAQADVQTINYNTYLLGREGYITLNLITDSARIADNKLNAKVLLNALHFQPGKTYSEYKPGTDKLAEYGLAALIGGIAVKKLGLLALTAGFFAKFAKLIAVGVVAGGAALRKILGTKKPDSGKA